MKNKYGYFSTEQREYVITDPRTPRPWFNYIWNENYGGLISHTGGGFSFLDTPRDNRLTRMRYNSLPWDRPGRYVIVKDTSSGKYWSLSWAPTIDFPYESYECRHGQGYTKITTIAEGIKGEITYFVPRNSNTEIWKVKLTNLTKKKRDLEIYSFTELMMGNALNDIINQPNDKHFTDIKFNKENETLIATRRYWVLNKKVSVAQPNIDWKYNLLFTSTLPVKGFDGSLDNFIGKWRSEANPLSVETGKMNNTEITAGDPVAALKNKTTISSRETIEFAVIMGVAPKEENAFKALNWKKLKTVAEVDKLYKEVTGYWDNYLSHVKVNTPDKNMNIMVNVWNQYQAAVTFDMARNSGYYHGGLLFGTGMRDQFQDILGMVIVEPDRVRKRLLNALRFQFNDGSTLHNFFKITDYGEKTNHSDTPLWIPFGIVEYIKETGDFTILDEKVTYYNEGTGTVYEHLVKAVNFAISATSKRGIPKIMNGDWNDTLDHIGPRGKGETIWGGFFLAFIIKHSIDLIKHLNDKKTLIKWEKKYKELKKVINTQCWDGNWYIRATRDDGSIVGSSKDKQGKIFINAQTWSVISGIAPDSKGSKALASCKKYLTTPYGMKIVHPSYTKVEDNTGLISRCVPGKKENGAVFNHASSWFILASILNGDPDSAFEVYSKMLPLNSAKDIDRYEVEPYVFAEYVTSPDHETENQASHSWLTGTAVWMYRIALDYILGFRTSIDGITISPNIPSHWKGFKAERKYRGKVIKLEVVRKKNKKDSSSIKINGKEEKSYFINPDKFSADTIDVKIII
jgi:cellobiose phosphorylase